jgi:hypothetical protein
VCSTWPDTGDNVEAIEADRPNAGSPASPGRRRRRHAATTVHVTASPLSPLVQRATVRLAAVAGHRHWTLALARHFARHRTAHPTDRLLVGFEIDDPIVGTPCVADSLSTTG